MQMKGYIAPSAPLNIELCDGSEQGLRLIVGFTPNWFHKRVGVSFHEQYHVDPYFRFKQIEIMHKHLRDSFPSVPYFQEHEAAQECATITGVYGICPVGMAYGRKPIYREDGWPAFESHDRFTLEEVEKLEPICVANTAVGENLLRQIEIIGKEWGQCDGYLNYQGILNSGFMLLGEDALVYMIEEPERMETVFSHATATTIDLMKTVQSAQRKTGFPWKEAGIYTVVGLCLTNMISPQLYEEMILKYDREMEAAMEWCGIHTCNWVIDRLAPKLAKMEEPLYIDFSVHSNLEQIEKLFPKARKLAIFGVDDFIGRTNEEIETKLIEVKEHFGSCDVLLPDLEFGTPDEEIVRFSNIVEKVSGRY